MAIEIVDFPINSMVVFHGYVSLPEGKSWFHEDLERHNVRSDRALPQVQVYRMAVDLYGIALRWGGPSPLTL